MITYHIDKFTGTAADTLLMAGFARFLNNLHYHTGHSTPSLHIQDCGASWQIRCDVVLTDDDLEQVEPFDVLTLLVTQSQRKNLGDLSHRNDFFDYDAEQEKFTAYRQQLATLPARYRTPGAEMTSSDDPALQEQLEQISQQEPRPDLPLYAAINQMKIASSYNDLIHRWEALRAKKPLWCEHIRLLLHLFSTSPNPTDEVMEALATLAKQHKLGKTDATLLQIVNPITGKGLNRPKADGLSVGSISDFWLFEMFKFAGFFVAALPQRIQNSDDRKTYVLRARVLNYHDLQDIMDDFRKVLWPNSPAKLDILAALYLARVLIEKHRDALRSKAEAERRKRRRPDDPIMLPDLISGLDTTFYKSLGSAVATMNLSFVALPDWLPLPESPTDANRFIHSKTGLLTEHIRIITQLEENKGEEEALLHHYRTFLSSRDPSLNAFFAFTRGYATYAMRHLAHKEYVPLFSTESMEVLMEARDQQHEQEKPLKSIIAEHEGFRNIARAIRESTIRAQYRVAQENDRRYDIAYGLGQELARSLNHREAFLAALMDFIRRYNAETAREEEKLANQNGGKLTADLRRRHRLRRLVTTEDIEDLFALFDEYRDEYKMVGNLLLAYGYAFDSSARTAGETIPQETEISATETEGV